MQMFHLPSKLEILDPFWDLPQQLLKDWGRTPLFSPISLCTHIQSMPFFRLTAAIYPTGEESTAAHPTCRVRRVVAAPKWSLFLGMVRQRRTVRSIL